MPKYEAFRVPSFIGGYNSKSALTHIRDDQFTWGSHDVRLSEDGAAAKRNGYRKVLSDAGSSWAGDYTETLGLFQFYDPSEKRTLVRIARAPSGGSANDVRFEVLTADVQTTASNWDTNPDGLGSSLGTVTSSEQYCDGAEFLSDLFIACPGLGALVKLNYASGWSAPANVSTSGTARTLNKPKCVEVWHDRLWICCDASVENGSYLLWSNATGSSFDLDNDYLQIVGEGPITGLKRLGTNLVVFKQDRIFVLSGGADPTNQLRLRQLSSDVGSLSHRLVVEADKWLYFLSARGFYRTDGNNLEFIGDNVEVDLEKVHWADFKKAFGIHHKMDSEVCFFIPITGGSSGGAWGTSAWGSSPWGGGSPSRYAFVFDTSRKAWCAPYTNQPFTCATLMTNEVSSSSTYDEQIMIVGSDTGNNHIYQWNYGETDDGTYTNAEVVTRPYDLGDPGLMKIVRKLYLRIGEVGSDNAYVPVKVQLYKQYGNIGSATAISSATHQLSKGSEFAPIFTDTRHNVGMSSRNIRFKFSDYNDGTVPGGNWILQELVALFSTKGRRSNLG